MEIPRHWRTTHQRLRLQGEICPSGHKLFPPRDNCPKCGSKAKEPYNFSGLGTIYSHTTIYEAPSTHEGQTPYTLALVELDEGPLITAQITDIDPQKPVKIDTPVEMVTRKLSEQGETGMIIYGYKFRPIVWISSPKEASTFSK